LAVAPGAPNRIALGCLLIVAACLRLAVAHSQHNLIWADEVFQVLEPAHRLVYGNGLVAWEWVVGMRSWLFPGAIASMLWLGRPFGPNPAMEMVPVQLFLVAASLIPVVTAYRWGERLKDVWGGLLVGGFVALWVDLIYIAPHPLADVIAGDVLMGGLYAALPLTTRPSLTRLAIAGALFGLTFALRMQLGPALLVATIFACGRAWRSWLAVILGGGAVLLVSGGLDWVTLGTPFQSIWLNFWLNVVKGVSNDFGVMPPAYFAAMPLTIWGLVALPILFQFAMGARRFPALFAVVIAVFLTQSLFAHKEWRFIFPALAPLITLCGIGAVEEIKDLEPLLGRLRSPSRALTITALGLWTALSLIVAIGPGYREKWTYRREFIDAFAAASRQPGLCGVEVVDFFWPDSPGSAALPPGIPIYGSQAANARHDAPSYNVAVADGASAMPRDLYRKVACFDGSLDSKGAPQRTACVWVRNGGCKTGAASVPSPYWPDYFLNADGSPRPDRIQPFLPRRGSM
jgi:hypothetical protein